MRRWASLPGVLALAVLWCPAVLLGSVLAGAGSAAGAVGAGTASTLQLTTDVLVPGHTVGIVGAGWAPNTALQASVCGGDALQGSVDCAVTSAATFSAGPNGQMTGTLVAAIPPQPCPCVVLVASIQGGYERTYPVSVLGAPSAPVQLPPTKAVGAVTLDKANVTGGVSLRSVFGGPAARTLHVTVTNHAGAPASPIVVAHLDDGAGSDVITVPPLTLAAHQTRTVRVPFQLGWLSFGRYQVDVRLAGMGSGTVDRSIAATSTYPWALLGIGLALILVLGVWALRAVRRRRAGVADPTRAAAYISAAGPTPAVAQSLPRSTTS